MCNITIAILFNLNKNFLFVAYLKGIFFIILSGSMMCDTFFIKLPIIVKDSCQKEHVFPLE